MALIMINDTPKGQEPTWDTFLDLNLDSSGEVQSAEGVWGVILPWASLQDPSEPANLW